MSFSSNLKKLRQDRKLSQNELGDILGVTGANVARWEKQDSNNPQYPRVDVLIKIAKYFGVSIDFLLDFNLTEGQSVINRFNELLGDSISLEIIDNNLVAIFQKNFDDIKKKKGDRVLLFPDDALTLTSKISDLVNPIKKEIALSQIKNHIIFTEAITSKSTISKEK